MSAAEVARIRINELGWTVDKLALEMGVTPSAIYQWEGGTQAISESKIQHLRALLRLKRVTA